MPKGHYRVTREQRSQISAIKAIAKPHKIAWVKVYHHFLFFESSSAIPEKVAIGLKRSMIMLMIVVHARANYLKNDVRI